MRETITRFAGVCVAVAGLALSGCTSVTSTPTRDCTGADGKDCMGITYFLPKRYVSLTIERAFDVKMEDGDETTTENCSDTIRVTMQPAQPDLEHHYTANLRHNIVTNDELSIGINQRGLLDSRDTLSDSLGESGPDLINYKVRVDDDDECLSDRFARIFDPTEPIQITLPDPYQRYRIQVADMSSGPPALPDLTEPTNGILYRRGLPYLFTLDECSESDCVTRQASRALFPNKGPVGILPYKTNAFVKNKYNVKFVDGQLVRWDANRPAEVIEIVKIPLELLQTVVEVPMRILGVAN